MTYKEDQEKKNKLLTIAAVIVLIFAVLPIVAFAVFSVVDFKPVAINKTTVEEPILSRTEQRKLEREAKKAEEAAKQTVTQNQPVMTTETMPQPGQMPFGQGFGPGQFGQGQFGPGMGMGQFGNFDPANMPQFDPSQFQGMGPGGMGFGQGFDPANMPQFDPAQMGGFGNFGGGFGQGGFPGGMQGGMPDFGGMQGGFGQGMQGGFNGGFQGGFQGGMNQGFNNANGGPNIITPNPSQPAGNQ